MFWLRFNLDVPEPFLADMAQTLAWVVPLQAVIFLALGSTAGCGASPAPFDLQRICGAAGLGALGGPGRAGDVCSCRRWCRAAC